MSLRDRLEKARSGAKQETSEQGKPLNVSSPGLTIAKPQIAGERPASPARFRRESVGRPYDGELSVVHSKGESSKAQAYDFPLEDPHLAVKEKIHHRLVKEIEEGLVERTASPDDRQRLAKEVESIAMKVLDEETVPLMRSEKVRIITEVIDDVMGFGPITPLLGDETITEIMVNGPYSVYIERGGRIEETSIRFRDVDHVRHIIDRIVSPIGRRIDDASPMVDARLPDGSRVNAVIPPISLVGPCITIRKFAREPLTTDDLIRLGTLTPEMIEFLDGAVKARLNIVVSGGTGSGKTTTLNVLSSFIPADERIVT
ncbi:MAG TPA: CpaF family protein, partial [Firmicutes bacterium]|nr:CpaF family protein [Bacillota bacterium]